MHAVVERILEQFEVLKHMFAEEIPNKHQSVKDQPRVIPITEMLRSSMTLISLHFLSFALRMLNKYE